MTTPENGTEQPRDHDLVAALRVVGRDIRRFIDLSLQEPEVSWQEWPDLLRQGPPLRCWERKGCVKKDCPAFGRDGGRCWLIAGTMCAGGPVGDFAVKYKSCTECDVYQESVFRDPVAEIYEHLITLVHSLKVAQERLKTMAIRDLLTGLYNRNYFHETICREMDKARRYGHRFSLLMIDVDNFKRINDDYGHLHGDGVLCECARILTEAVRSSDLLFRYGGDEFLILTPETDCRGDQALIARTHELVRAWNEEYGSPGYRLSLSIGCATWEEGKELRDVLDEADTLMYRDKAGKAAP